MFKKSKVFIALTLVFALLVSTCSAATYTVKKGDNLWKLAVKFFGNGMDYTKIVEANPAIKDPNLIYVDQVLTIPEEGVPADEAIVGVKTEGFVDNDGAKFSKVIVEYNMDLTGADITTETYKLWSHVIANGGCEIGADSNPGGIKSVSVDGNKVIIDVNIDYQLGKAIEYREGMAVGVTQVKDITVGGAVITASDTQIDNFTVTEEESRGKIKTKIYADPGTYTISGIEDYQLFTKEAGNAFLAEDCFEEATGEYVDVELPYALYVPDDYDPSKEYALVLHIHDAGWLGDDPMLTLTETQGPANFASDAVQQIVKEDGLGGIIVVAPQINSDLRSVRDNWSTSAAVPATWKLLDSVIANYNIDDNRIYATGGSMGGMQSLAMAAQRDNFFAAVWAIGCQWGNNYNLENIYRKASYYETPADGELIWTVDAHGNPVDYRNFYYLISDDNVLCNNCVGDHFSTCVWQEMIYLYSDLTGTEIPKATWNPLTLTPEEQSAEIAALMAQENETGIYWAAFNGGNHDATWLYAHGVPGTYEWFLTQTRESEMAREKLDLNKPFVAAAEQIKTTDRILSEGATEEENVYYVTGQAGSGTADYNTSTFAYNGAIGALTVLDHPGWKPANTAEDAIVSVKTEGFVDNDGAKFSKVIVEYNVDLTGADITTETYELWSHVIAKGGCEIGADSNPGGIKSVSVDGNKVIIDVNIDYQLGKAIEYREGMAVGVTQVKPIVADNAVVSPSEKQIDNFTETEVVSYGKTKIKIYADPGTYTISGIEDYQLFTKEAGNAFLAKNCFEEATGEYVDVELPYALYVPDDYDPSKEYALVLHIHDAGWLGDDPMLTLTETQGPANFASDAVQQIVKKDGLGGIIVVAPQINGSLRSVRDNWSTSAAVPATWKLVDSIIADYNIDMNRIYATGGSMGGMQSLAMAAQRDNFFAAIWAVGCQWGSNHNLEEPYKKSVYYEAPADGEIIWTVDADGNEVDYRNFYYLLSDDNVLCNNCVGDKFSSCVWQELAFLYYDLAGVEIPKTTWNPLTLSPEEQSAEITALVAEKYDQGFYWAAFDGGNHDATWLYAHGVPGTYEWFLTQTRESEMAREKLDLDKPFVAAAEQIRTEDRLLQADAENPENNIYYVTGEYGSGTADYNTSTYTYNGAIGAQSVIEVPNWKPNGEQG